LKIYLFIGCFCLLLGCQSAVTSSTVVYSNDFQSNNLAGINNGVISQYNGSAVLGQYNNSSFSVAVGNLPKHDVLTISFDLYIHDSWDGNAPAPDGPDIWGMNVDGNSYINTTFSNNPCNPGYFCAPQSYPADYPNNYNDPKVGAYRTDLPGVCSKQGIIGWTTQYKITKTIRHSASSVVLTCFDQLVQSNIAVSQRMCDESWSVDNIQIQAITQ
jgi:hypothetical protein